MAAVYETGYPFYGQNIGVLVFSTQTPRIKGDAGNAGTFPYPVRYEIVKGGFSDLIHPSREIEENLLAACENLKNLGIRAIIGDCGLMSLYQHLLPAQCGLPVGASSLCLIPTIRQLIGPEGAIGVITGHSKLLSREHLERSGWREDIPLEIQGMEEEPHFRKIVIEGGLELDADRMRGDVLHAGEAMLQRNPNIRAILLECSNLPSYSWDLRQRFGLPVFDILSLAGMLEYAVNPPRFL